MFGSNVSIYANHRQPLVWHVKSTRVMHRCKLLMLLRRHHVAHALVDAIVKSYTPQSADLMRLTIELMTLDISGMGYGKIAERVA